MPDADRCSTGYVADRLHGVTVRVVAAAGDGYLVQVIGTYRAAGSLPTF